MAAATGSLTRERGRTRTLAVVDGRFRCDGCSRWHDAEARTSTGFCIRCIERGRKWWRGQMPLDELLELARACFPQTREERPKVAA